MHDLLRNLHDVCFQVWLNTVVLWIKIILKLGFFVQIKMFVWIKIISFLSPQIINKSLGFVKSKLCVKFSNG